jgi:hypothetical protein
MIFKIDVPPYLNAADDETFVNLQGDEVEFIVTEVNI